MAPETLRLILIVLGVVVIGAIFLFGNPERRSRQASSKRTGAKRGSNARRDPGRQTDLQDTEHQSLADSGAASSKRSDDDQDGSALQQELQALGNMIAGDRGEKAEQKGKDSESVTELRDKPGPPRRPKKPAGPPPQHIVTLLVSCGPTRPITGVQLLDAAIKAGLVFGESDIFHRTLEGDDTPVFSMANMVKPGHFDRTAWNSFETPGVMLFMTLPGPMGGLDAWDSMLATAQRLAELLSAEILDEQRTPLSRQRIAQIRDTMRDYDRRRDQGKS